ncbi:MAG TPA: condensation domain-containing protein, partial [Pyrinomonadaceae bacterium]|nr:condensation domain-containing protein [Pyrinomonadaceae bacterium]
MPGLPLTENGKVDRNALPAPDEVPSSTTVYVPPKTAIEEIVAGIWCEVLGVDQVGTTENFFDLGGHSLLATQIIARMREAFQVELPLRTLLEANTVASLAEGIEQGLRTGALPPAPPLIRVNRDGVLPLSFAQQRLWFIDQLEPGSAVYNIPAAIRLTGHLDLSALQESLNRLTARHEILRTTFITEAGKPRVQISDPEPFSVPITDLSAMLPDDRNDEARRLVREEVIRPFDLSCGPLLRVKLIALQAEEHVLLLVMHHIIADGWSIGVMIRELSALYNAIAEGREPELQDLPVQYVDYASWQREWLRDEVLQEQLSYWKQQLEGAPALLELPADRPRPATPTHRGGQERFIIPSDVSRSLRELSKREGATLFMLLLAAFKVLLMRYSGQTDVVVGTPIAGRRHKEVEGLIGLFVNALVMRTDISGDPRFKDLLKRVKETCLGAFSHQDVPFEKLVDELQPERASSHSPLFQVVFAMQNVPRERIALSGLEASGAGIEGEIAKFDLSMVISEAEDSLIGGLEYNSDLFDRERITRLATHFQTILA